MSALLRVLRDGKTVSTHELMEAITVGRAEGCVIRLEDHAISRKHALLTPDSGGKLLKFERKSDFGWLRHNGVECTQGVARPGDIIELGPFRIEFESASPGGAPVPGALSDDITPVVPVQASPVAEPMIAPLVISELEAPVVEAPAPPPAQAAISEPPLTGIDPGLLLDPLPTEPMSETPAVQDPDAPLEMNLAPLAEESPPQEPLGSDTAGSDGVGDGSLVQLDVPGETAASASGAGGATGIFDPEGATRLTPVGGVVGRLVFSAGSANVETFDISGKATIGRGGAGKPVDVELRDKKCSRQHLEIHEQQGRYLLRDLGSENGTILNGEKIPPGAEVDLPSGSTIRAGETQFRFEVFSQDYQVRQGSFLPATVSDSGGDAVSLDSGSFAQADTSPGDAPFHYDPSAADPSFGMPPEAVPLASGLQSPVTEPTHPPGLKGLMSRYKAQPLRTRLMLIAVAAAFVMLFSVEDEDETKAKKPKPKPSASAGVTLRRLEDLSPEQQNEFRRYLEQSVQYFKLKQYTVSRQWVDKALEIFPTDEKALATKSLIEEALREIKALEEKEKAEKAAQEDQEKLKRILSELEDMMIVARKRARSATRYEDVERAIQDNVDSIMRINPDEESHRKWQQEISDDKNRYTALEGSRKQARELTAEAASKRAQIEPFRKAVEGAADPIEKLRRLRALHENLEILRDSIPPDSPDEDKEVSAERKKIARIREGFDEDVATCHQTLESFMTPHLEEVRTLEKAAQAAGNPEEHSKVFARWAKVAELEDELELAWLGQKKAEELKPQGRAGMERIRGLLKDRAKALYTEGILAESYSDFTKAREKFEELLRVAPADDISPDSYVSRAKRKIALYSQFDKALGKERLPAGDSPPSESSASAPVESAPSEPAAVEIAPSEPAAVEITPSEPAPAETVPAAPAGGNP